MIPWIPSAAPPDAFPPLSAALRDPNGLLAAGGDLTPQRLVAAYRRGIFPWFGPGEPILWWSPDPRAVLTPEKLHVSRRLARFIRSRHPEIRIDREFAAVIQACAARRPTQPGTWITAKMMRAYQRLFERGIAHCAESLIDGEVVGGIYGLAIGRVFFGESMYTRRDNGSKLALIGLCVWLQAHGFRMLDCQVESRHLSRLGAESWPRSRFVDALNRWVDDEPDNVRWPSRFCLSGGPNPGSRTHAVSSGQ